MNVTGAAVLDVAVGITLAGCRMGRIRSMSRVPVSGQMHDVLDGLTSASSEHDGGDSNQKDDNTPGHARKSLRQAGGGVK
jgi:hypothetical protein